MQYVGFGRRFVAWLLDSVIVDVIMVLINFLVLRTLSKNALVGVFSMYSLNFVMVIGYYTWYQAKTGQTLGKKVMGIRVVDGKGKTPGALTFFLRDIVGKMVSGIILGIGYLMVLWDGKKQALHDKIASTYVVRA